METELQKAYCLEGQLAFVKKWPSQLAELPDHSNTCALHQSAFDEMCMSPNLILDFSADRNDDTFIL
jgi:hypothetical protein